MIYLGTPHNNKLSIVDNYIQQYNVNRVVVISPLRFFDAPHSFLWPSLNADVEVIEYTQTVEYAVFYRLLQEVDRRTLIVMNECLRTQDRNCLTYNCIRHFLNQAGHQLIFQYLPIIDGIDDIFILFDFDTKSKWKRERDISLLKHASFSVWRIDIEFKPVVIEASGALHDKYQASRDKMFATLGKKDPHTIPRNLVLMSGREKAQVTGSKWHIVRNKRLRMARSQTYRDKTFEHAPYVILDPCHRFIDMADMLSLSGQESFDYLMTDLKVEHWYLCQYTKWIGRINEVYSAIQQSQRS